ncbi:carboxy-S-adenosyl-L-methionine synthase CmoA [Methylomarinum sp. Ch1-1]|uniref:Carboxy-S-adenosyl-L-methionine synthase n=1 Tax=Methylomarinum roseum TaxID=3067653 RepID=A0AAU7NTU2_9GAMM|nr:carboxy-S-adenosyl-L-methionine synthase CmoA [Methylomarinum sp. Ch1-1]MDP4519554.1 carboxy-S-adenosyl-L-methionine synthase CmoA [Methylomarinum sp. Ch1-1]
MTQEDRIFQHINRVDDFTFDERVATVFDNMVARSVPFYSEIQRLQSDLIMAFLPEQDGVVCDLGCSTGTTIEHIINHPQCPETAKFIGYDNSEPMLDQTRAKLSTALEEQRVSLLIADLSALPVLPACNVVILNWTLQFVRPIDREHLLKNIYSALKPGGVLFLSEKILSSDAALNRLYIDHYLQFKKSQSGYTDTENQRKREALENVLIPYRLEENYLLLERAGFKRIDTYFRWLNFACLIAVK